MILTWFLRSHSSFDQARLIRQEREMIRNGIDPATGMYLLLTTRMLLKRSRSSQGLQGHHSAIDVAHLRSSLDISAMHHILSILLYSYGSLYIVPFILLCNRIYCLKVIRMVAGLDMNDETAVNDAKPRRTFKPFYKSTGDVMSDKLAFFHILEELKVHICYLVKDRH
jgi:hypothetical protein